MDAFKQLTSSICPVPLRNVDTDMIIPAQFLTSISRDGFGENLFAALREKDANFPTTQQQYANAQVLVGDSNFGCGSSREHAVWAIVGAGFKVVIAKSFADIFFNNSAKNGLLLVTLPEDVVDSMFEQGTSGTYEVTVSLENQTVVLPDGSSHSFEYDPFRKHCMLNGLDDIDYIRSSKADIDVYLERSADRKFFSTTHPNR